MLVQIKQKSNVKSNEDVINKIFRKPVKENIIEVRKITWRIRETNTNLLRFL